MEVEENRSCISRTRQRKRQQRDKLSGRMKSDPSTWKKKQRKHAQLAGKEHVNTAGNLVRENLHYLVIVTMDVRKYLGVKIFLMSVGIS